jgi:hypothetical protein
MKSIAIIFVVAVSLAGCANPAQWQQAGISTQQRSVDNAKCKLFAESGGQSGFVVAGSEQFVAAASAGHAIGSPAHKYALYSDCIEALGYTDVQ